MSLQDFPTNQKWVRTRRHHFKFETFYTESENPSITMPCATHHNKKISLQHSLPNYPILGFKLIKTNNQGKREKTKRTENQESKISVDKEE